MARKRIQVNNDAGSTVGDWVSVSRIMPWPGNPRVNKHAVRKVADSIKRFGWGAPIIARLANGEIIAGHTRYAAALLLGMREVPVRFMDVNERDAHSLALADNRLGELAVWDDCKLREALADCERDAAVIAGWSPGEIESLLADSVGIESPESQWCGMPEFESEDKQPRRVVVQFATQEDAAVFFGLIDQPDTGKTDSIWFPAKPQRADTGEHWGCDET